MFFYFDVLIDDVCWYAYDVDAHHTMRMWSVCVACSWAGHCMYVRHVLGLAPSTRAAMRLFSRIHDARRHQAEPHVHVLTHVPEPAHPMNHNPPTSAIWLSRGYAFVNLRNPMFSRTFLDIVCDAVVKEGAQPLRVFPARHQGIEELRAHHRAQMQERSNRVYSRMPPVFM